MRPESTLMIMDTSKDYYESFMHDFRMYGRRRTPEQFCRDEGADFKNRKREDHNQDKLIRHEADAPQRHKSGERV